MSIVILFFNNMNAVALNKLKLTKLALLFLLIFNFCYGYSQNIPKLDNVIPPSPDAAALGKYGNTPVGLYTGVPEISIPLYTIKSKLLEVPISLSYHAGGIKVNEIASWVGLGFTLNAGGVISRSVVGKSDDSGGGFWYNQTTSASQIGVIDYENLHAISIGLADGESDYYFYNFPGHSGKFIYRQNNGFDPVLIPQSPIVVKYVNGHYEVTDEMGNLYKFAATETTVLHPSNEEYKSSFYLSRIISADKTDSIDFSYVQDNYFYESSSTTVYTLAQKCDLVRVCTTNDAGEVRFDHQYTLSSTAAYDMRNVYPLRLSEINYAHGKVKFISEPGRLDVTGQSRVARIEVYAKKQDNTFAIQKSFVLNIDYFTGTVNGTDRKYRLKLTGLIEKNLLGDPVKKHAFDYHDSPTFPGRGTFGQDWWGFYNGRNNNEGLVGREEFSRDGHVFVVGSNCIRQPHSTHMQAHTLKKIIYPTGGYTEFDYEPHYYDSSSTTAMAGGLRVKEIRDYEGINALPVKKLYKYGNGENGKGILLMPANGFSLSRRPATHQVTLCRDCGVDCEAESLIISGRQVYDLTSFNGAAVVYPEVAVYESSTGAPNGKSVHRFNVEPDQIIGAPTGYSTSGGFQLSTSWKGGKEISQILYKGNTTTKVEETTHEYGAQSQLQITATKTGRMVTVTGYCSSIASKSHPSDYFYYFDYPIETGIYNLRTKVQKVYAGTESLTTTTQYEYDNLGPKHQQLSRKITLDSEGNTLTNLYWYPADYGNIENFPTLRAKNIIAIPVKEETHKSNQIVTGKVSKFNADGKPTEIHLYESTTPQAPPVHNGTVAIPPGYNKRAQLDYDATSKNIIKTQLTDNSSTAYIWGYKNSYPIAMVANANTTDVAATSFESDGKGNWIYTGPTYNDISVKTGSYYYKLGGGNITKSVTAGKYKLEYWAKGTVNITEGTITAIRTSTADANGWILYEKEVTMTATTTLTLSGSSTAFLDELRFYPATAQMTTYTYDGINGISSVTDPNNGIGYYNYDAFGRLKWILDKDGNIVKGLEYHYVGN